MRLVAALLIAVVVSACSSSKSGSATHVLADYRLADGFFAAPFPDDNRMGSDGHPDVAAFPNPTSSPFLSKVIQLIGRDAHGFSTTAGIYFALDGPLDPTTAADPAASVADTAKVFLIDVDDASPERGKKKPVSVYFDADGGPFGTENLLSLIPLQGIPLRPDTRYAAVVLKSVIDLHGKRLGAPHSLSELIKGHTPDGMSDAVAGEYEKTITALGSFGVHASSLAGLAVFTTDDPTAGLVAVEKAMLQRPMPMPVQPFKADEVFADYCVFSSTIEMPDYQSGTPPFHETGGDWLFDASGKPIFQRNENARIVVTVPRQKMPPAGFPIVLFSRTGGGGDRPLVDRGVQAQTGGPALVPGTGPALGFAKVGWAGASVDGPHGGLRNITGGDEQFLMFNVTNPGALRDNVRQSAAELALQAHVLEKLSFDASSCPGLDTGGGPVIFDPDHFALMGHSMGATISPLTLATEPAFKAGILSGEGGSWIENVLYKLHPVVVKGFAEALLGVAGKYSLDEQDPALNMFQWGAEPADPPAYARYIVREPRQGAPRDILMVQGIVDHYIMPTISEASSLSLGLDFAGKALDSATPEIKNFPFLDERLQFSGRKHISLPATGNIDPHTTAIVVQQREDGVEDGHEVVFQTQPPKHMYRCFLASLLGGTPTVPAPADENAPCP